MTKKITVGYDGSEPSHAALRWAGQEAVALGASVDVVQCYPDAMTSVAAAFTITALEASASMAKQAAQGAAALLHEDYPDLTISPATVCGSPGYALIDGVGEDEMVVLGGSAHHGALAAILGTTPRAVVRRAPCPVIVVPGESLTSPPRRIVVGVDGSPGNVAAINWAADEADLHRTPLLVLHAWEYPYTYALGYEPTTAHDVMHVDAQRVLDGAVETARERCGAEVTGMLVERGAVGALLQTVQDGDLLVLGSGRPARSGLLGSVPNRVMDEVDVPIVVVPS